MADFAGTLQRYVGAVAAQCHVGPELCVVDPEEPAWGYIALAWRLPRHPDRDLALLWDERTGWSLAIETNSGEDLILVTGVGDGSVVLPPSGVQWFVDHVTERGGWLERAPALFHRAAGMHDRLADQMTGVLRQDDVRPT